MNSQINRLGKLNYISIAASLPNWKLLPFLAPEKKASSPAEGSRSPVEQQCVLDPVRKAVLEQCPDTCRLLGGWFGGWGREAKLENLGSHVFLRLWDLQSTSGCKQESIAEFGEGLWAMREGSDPEHGTSPADGGHGPSCTQAAPVAGERSLWTGGATEKGKCSIPLLSYQGSTLGRSGATSTESLHVSKLCWPFPWSPQPVGSGAGLNSSQHNSLEQIR